MQSITFGVHNPILFCISRSAPINKYMLKINNWNTKIKCEILTMSMQKIKLTMSMPKRLVVLVSVLFILNMNNFFECFFYYLLWKYECLVGNVSLNLKMELQSLRKPIYQFLSYASIFWEKLMFQVEQVLKAASVQEPGINKHINTYLFTKF